LSILGEIHEHCSIAQWAEKKHNRPVPTAIPYPHNPAIANKEKKTTKTN